MSGTPFYPSLRFTRIEGFLYDVERNVEVSERPHNWVWVSRVSLREDVEVLRGSLTLGEKSVTRTMRLQILNGVLVLQL